MLYLLMAIVCSASIPNLFKLAHKRDCRQAPIITFNYLMCVIIVVASFWFTQSAKQIFTPNMSDVARQSLITAVLIGVVCGALYYLGFYYYQKAVRVSGPALSSAVGKTGIIIPIILSVVIWCEYPSFFAIAGICLALFAIFYLYFDFKLFSFNQIHIVLIVFFLFTVAVISSPSLL